jgi:hypothetical protein
MVVGVRFRGHQQMAKGGSGVEEASLCVIC